MKSTYSQLKSAQSSIGHNKSGVSASGGYLKIGQMFLNGVVHTTLFAKKAGVMADAAIGDVRTIKEVWVDTEAENVQTYEKDVKSLEKQLKKVKKQKARKELQADIKKAKEVVAYYKKQLSKARKL